MTTFKKKKRQDAQKQEVRLHFFAKAHYSTLENPMAKKEAPLQSRDCPPN